MSRARVHSVRPRGTSAQTPALPTWLAGVDVNEWVEITGSSMSNTPPSSYQQFGGSAEACRVNNWNGFALDTRSNKVWGLGNGGHGDYFGNEVMVLDLNADAPEWVEWLAPTAYSAAFVTASYPASPRHYDNSARLTGQHSYFNHQMIEAHDRVVRVYSGSVSSGPGTGFSTMDGFDVTVAQGVNGTDASFVYPVVDAGDTDPYNFDTQGPATCKDPSTEAIYLFKDSAACRKFTPSVGGPDGSAGSGGSWSTIGSAPASGFTGYLAASAFDSSRGRILVASCAYPHASNDTRFWTFDTSDNSYTERTLTGTPAADLVAASASPGMVYVPSLDAYLMRLHGSGGTVYKINASTWAVTTISTTGGGSVPATAELAGDSYATYENVYSKWLYVPSLGVVMYYPQYTSNVWALRVH